MDIRYCKIHIFHIKFNYFIMTLNYINTGKTKLGFDSTYKTPTQTFPNKWYWILYIDQLPVSIFNDTVTGVLTHMMHFDDQVGSLLRWSRCRIHRIFRTAAHNTNDNCRCAYNTYTRLYLSIFSSMQMHVCASPFMCIYGAVVCSVLNYIQSSSVIACLLLLVRVQSAYSHARRHLFFHSLSIFALYWERFSPAQMKKKSARVRGVYVGICIRAFASSVCVHSRLYVCICLHAVSVGVLILCVGAGGIDRGCRDSEWVIRTRRMSVRINMRMGVMHGRVWYRCTDGICVHVCGAQKQAP